MTDKKNKYIINTPEKISSFRRKGEWGITIIGWVIWLLVARPFLFVLLWLIGFKAFYTQMIKMRGLAGLFEFAGYYLFVIVFIYLSMRGWNLYNLYRFKGKDKRKFVKPVRPVDFDKLYEMIPGSTEKILQSKEIEVNFHENQELSFRVKKDDQYETIKGTLNFL